MESNIWNTLRGSLYSYIQSDDKEEIYKLANFIINGVLISDRVVIELNSLFPNNSQKFNGRALGDVADEEITFIKDELSEVLKKFNDFSFLEIVKENISFKFHFLLEEENSFSDFRALTVSIDSTPKTLIIFTGNKNKITRVSRIYESTDSIEALNILVNKFTKES